ncbi:MAG TPA: ABC transporter substrate-binding protein [Mycobacteriales bacterium]|nr:ABC transporter substrate-binding protein [Mycobacteriales bacterium]
MTSPRNCTPGRHRAGTLAALAAIAALAASACSSGSSGSPSAGAPSGSAVAGLGAQHPATGTPVTLGYIYDGTSEALDQTDDLEAAQATVKYVNTYRNGLGGHPMSLDVCSTDATPTGGRDCVAQMVRDKVPLVLNTESAEGNVMWQPLINAGVPIWLELGGTEAVDASNIADMVQNPLMTGIGGPALAAGAAGVTTAAIAVIGVPAATAGFSTGVPLLYGAFHIKTVIVSIPPGTPDPSPQVVAALTHHPGQFMVLGDESLCDAVLKALQNAGYHGQIVALAGCISAGAAKELTNLNGVLEFTTETSDPASPELKVFNAVMDAYAPQSIDRLMAKNDYQMIVALSLATHGLDGAATKGNIQHAINTMPPKRMPLAPQITFQCHHQLSEYVPAACSVDVLKTVLDSDGTIASSTVVKNSILQVSGT